MIKELKGGIRKIVKIYILGEFIKDVLFVFVMVKNVRYLILS